ncbi:MAG TPA: thermopsin family protease, partial [Thermoplasmata archaeon]|nr:thermopsin family protease [Thermoplasmata archaeon]
MSGISSAFDQRVLETASSLAAAGVPAHSIRLPYVGSSAQVVDGAVVPGYAVAAQGNVTQDYPRAPAPVGLAYYGENDTSGAVQATTLDASSVEGTLTVNQMDALYLDVDTPDMWGIQLNAVLTDVTLHGVSGYQFWVQNAVDVYQHNGTINLGEDTWNFSAPGAYIAPDTSTILSHDPNGSVIAGLYIGEGPWIHVPRPFTLALYVNSSVTASGDQELWYNYSVAAAGGVHESGNYDWIVFNSGGTPGLRIAPFEASGTGLDPVGLPNDFEFDFGIGGYNGADMDVLAANLSATLDYCPVTVAVCTPTQLTSVPAAENFGGETGETSAGLDITYSGTVATGAAGPFILRGLWGFVGATGSAAGSTGVTNQIAVHDSPDPSSTAPYVFVFLSTTSRFDAQAEWAPDVPVWHLAPGEYDYRVMLADYAEVTGVLTVGSAPTALTVTLEYNRSAGVYTPLWALSNAQLAGISTAGNGTVGNQYLLFNNPTSSCTGCGNATNGNLSPVFFLPNDFLFPTFSGILLVGTDAYVDVANPVSLSVYTEPLGGLHPNLLTFDLQIELVSTEHVTLAHDARVGGWPAMFETQTLAGVVNASQNVFPQASVMIWNSSHDLVMDNSFVPTPSVPTPQQLCEGSCPPITCNGCVPLDGLLLYGGAANTVWGNTFRDPVAEGGTSPYGTFAGLAEAESGDLVYNNNFSVDNPTVYLPFDIYTDACPDGYAGGCGPLVPPVYNDTWNVSSQPAKDVSDTVNGFALSGNIL